MLSFGASGCEKTKKKIPRLKCGKATRDRAGRELPPCGTDRLGTYRPRFGEQITSVTFSPNGRIIAAGGKDRLARFWDLMTGREVLTLGPHAGAVHAVDFSNDGRRFVTASTTVKLWDPRNGSLIKELKGHEGSILTVEFSHDGDLLVSSLPSSTSHTRAVPS